MVRRPAVHRFVPVAGVVGALIAGCPNLDQLGPGKAGQSSIDGGDLEGGLEPKGDGGSVSMPVDGLVGAWGFDGTGNVADDLSGNGHPAELAAGATQEADAGVRGGALVLHGLDNAKVPSLETSAFPRTGTIVLWLRYEAESPAGFSVFDNFDAARMHLFVRQKPRSEGTLQVGFQVTPDNEQYAWESSFSSVAAAWVHIAVAWDQVAQRAKLWVNGVSLRDAGFERPFNTDDQQFVLGDKLTGAIDEVRIFRRVLSDAEVKALAK